MKHAPPSMPPRRASFTPCMKSCAKRAPISIKTIGTTSSAAPRRKRRCGAIAWRSMQLRSARGCCATSARSTLRSKCSAANCGCPSCSARLVRWKASTRTAPNRWSGPRPSSASRICSARSAIRASKTSPRRRPMRCACFSSTSAATPLGPTTTSNARSKTNTRRFASRSTPRITAGASATSPSGMSPPGAAACRAATSRWRSIGARSNA